MSLYIESIVAKVTEDIYRAGRTVPVTFTVPCGKTNGWYAAYGTFISTGAVRYLQQYLNERRHGGARKDEHGEPYVPPGVMTDDSPFD